MGKQSKLLEVGPGILKLHPDEFRCTASYEKHPSEVRLRYPWES